MTNEMGSPITFSNEVQTVNALAHFKEMVSVFCQSYEFEHFLWAARWSAARRSASAA